MPFWIIMAAHPDVTLELMIGTPFAKALLKELFPPRFLMSGNSEGFTVCFLILAITSVAVTSFPSPGREGRLFQWRRKRVLCFVSVVSYVLLSTWAYWSFQQLQAWVPLSPGCIQCCSSWRQGCTCAASRERVPQLLYHPTAPFQMSMDSSAHIPLSYLTFHSAKRASFLCVIRSTGVHKIIGLVGRDNQQAEVVP